MEKELLIKFLKCETTPEEERLLVDWLESDPEHRKELDSMQLIMEGMALCAPDLEKMTSDKTSPRVSLFTRLAKISVAASIAIILAAGIGYNYISNKIDNLSNQKTMIDVPEGQRVQITLGDGTEVWLNSSAKLEYPSVFSGNQRLVKLSGEAMFNVKYDEKHPFIVETYACNIEVLGTKFNINADESLKSFSVALMSGSIKLTNKLIQENPIIMKVNEVVTLKDGHLHLKNIENHDEYLWTEGIISIHDISFVELMAKFEQIFNVQIEIRSKNIPTISYNRGKIRVSDGIDHALKILQLSSEFTYKKDPETGVITIL